MVSERFDPAWNWLPRTVLIYVLPLALFSLLLYRGLAWDGVDFWAPLAWGLFVPWLNTRAWAGRPWAFRDFLNRDSYPPLIAILHATVWSLAIAATRDPWAAAGVFFLFFMAYDGLLLGWQILSVYAIRARTQRRGPLAVLASYGLAWWGYLSLGLAAVHVWGGEGPAGIALATLALILPVQCVLLWMRFRRDAPLRMEGVRKVAVVGAGWSGIYAAKWLRECGLQVTWLEAEGDLGGVWKFRREASGGVGRNTRATSSKHFLHASDFPMPESFPDFPEHDEILAYLRSYADRFGLRESLATGRQVTRVVKSDGSWLVRTRDGDGSQVEERFDAVAVCAGPHQTPRLDPSRHPLYGRFEGAIQHAGDVKDASEASPSETVLIVGAGESAADLAAEFAHRGAKVWWASRRGQWFADRNIGPYAADHFTAVGLRVLLARFFCVEHFVRHFIIAPFIDLAWGRGGHGIAEWAPAAPYLHQFLNKSRDAVREVYRGRVRAVSAPSEIDGRRVRFEGSPLEAEVDRLILATGYKPNWPFLEKPPGRLFKKVFSLDDPTLAFVGHVRPVLGSIPSLAEAQARWIGHVWSGRTSIPCARRRRTIDLLDRRLQRRAMLDSSRLGVLVDQETYATELASFVNAEVHWLKLLLTHPRGFWAALRSPWTAFKYQLNGPDPEKRRAAAGHILREMPESKKPGRGGHPVFLLNRFLALATLALLAALAIALWVLPAWLTAALAALALLAGGISARLAAPPSRETRNLPRRRSLKRAAARAATVAARVEDIRRSEA